MRTRKSSEGNETNMNSIRSDIESLFHIRHKLLVTSWSNVASRQMG